jgi:hypothetical protein
MLKTVTPNGLNEAENELIASTLGWTHTTNIHGQKSWTAPGEAPTGVYPRYMPNWINDHAAADALLEGLLPMVETSEQCIENRTVYTIDGISGESEGRHNPVALLVALFSYLQKNHGKTDTLQAA